MRCQEHWIGEIKCTDNATTKINKKIYCDYHTLKQVKEWLENYKTEKPLLLEKITVDEILSDEIDWS